MQFLLELDDPSVMLGFPGVIRLRRPPLWASSRGSSRCFVDWQQQLLSWYPVKSSSFSLGGASFGAKDNPGRFHSEPAGQPVTCLLGADSVPIKPKALMPK